MRRRIFICLGLLLALCLVGVAIALFGIDRGITNLDDLEKTQRIQDMRADFFSSGLRIERDSLAQLLGKPLTEEEQAESRKAFDRSLRGCRSCHPGTETPLERKLAEIEKLFGTWTEKASSLYATQPEVQLNGEAAAQLISTSKRLVELTSTMVELGHSSLRKMKESGQAKVHNAWLALWGTLVAALVFGGAVAFHLQRRLNQPVAELLDGIERFRRGDITHELKVSGDEEFQSLGDAFNAAYRDLKSAQDGILQAEKMAAVGKLAAGVAHEVANPLASISSVAQIMRRGDRSEEDTKQIKLIMEHIDRISRIVRELLTFSRPPRDDRQGRIEIVSVLEHAMGLVKYDKRARGIRIVSEHGPDLKPVRANPDRLVVVFTNILLNAFDALSEHPDGEATLTVSARQQGETVVLQFADNGPGMTEQQIENAFEPFFTTKQPGAGTGLGLWICYETIRRLNGAIRIEGRPGEGTTVILEIPCDGEPPGE